MGLLLLGFLFQHFSYCFLSTLFYEIWPNCLIYPHCFDVINSSPRTSVGIRIDRYNRFFSKNNFLIPVSNCSSCTTDSIRISQFYILILEIFLSLFILSGWFLMPPSYLGFHLFYLSFCFDSVVWFQGFSCCDLYVILTNYFSPILLLIRLNFTFLFVVPLLCSISNYYLN